MQDPTDKEMRDHIATAFAGLMDPHDKESNEFDIAEAIYWFAGNYHGGQWTNLYSVLSTSDYRPGPMTDGPEPDSQSAMIYSELESEFGIGGKA